MSDGMGREPAYLSSHATNRYFIPNWGNICFIYATLLQKTFKVLRIFNTFGLRRTVCCGKTKLRTNLNGQCAAYE